MAFVDLTVGDVTAYYDPDDDPNPGYVVGASDQWSDDSDDTYGVAYTTQTPPTGSHGTILLAPVGARNPAGATSIRATLRGQWSVENTGDLAQTGFIDFYDGYTPWAGVEEYLGGTYLAAELLGDIEELTTFFTPDLVSGGRTWSDVTNALANGTLFVSVSTGSPNFGTNFVPNTLIAYELVLAIEGTAGVARRRLVPRDDQVRLVPSPTSRQRGPRLNGYY